MRGRAVGEERADPGSLRSHVGPVLACDLQLELKTWGGGAGRVKLCRNPMGVQHSEKDQLRKD